MQQQAQELAAEAAAAACQEPEPIVSLHVRCDTDDGTQSQLPRPYFSCPASLTIGQLQRVSHTQPAPDPLGANHFQTSTGTNGGQALLKVHREPQDLFYSNLHWFGSAMCLNRWQMCVLEQVKLTFTRWVVTQVIEEQLIASGAGGGEVQVVCCCDMEGGISEHRLERHGAEGMQDVLKSEVMMSELVHDMPDCRQPQLTLMFRTANL